MKNEMTYDQVEEAKAATANGIETAIENVGYLENNVSRIEIVKMRQRAQELVALLQNAESKAA